MLGAVREPLNSLGYEVKEVLSFKEDTEGSGGCSTCYYDWDVLRFSCLMEDDSERSISVDMTLSELLNTIT